MADRLVNKSGKNNQGDITSLCADGAIWSPRPSADAIRDIESGMHTYQVSWSDGRSTQIRVVNGARGKYLRTDHDNTERNNLDDLANC